MDLFSEWSLKTVLSNGIINVNIGWVYVDVRFIKILWNKIEIDRVDEINKTWGKTRAAAFDFLETYNWILFIAFCIDLRKIKYNKQRKININ